MKHCQNKSNISVIRDYLSNTRPFTVVGYTPPPEEKHKDGTMWKDRDNKEWIQVGASKISKNLYDTRESTRQICATCKKDIFWGGDRYDEKFFNKTGKCYDCVIEEESKMVVDGTFGLYEKIKVIRNQKSFLIDLKKKIEESIEWLTNKSNKIKYLNEDGSYEDWTDLSRDTFLTEANIDLKEINKSMIICDESISMLEEKLNELKSK